MRTITVTQHSIFEPAAQVFEDARAAEQWIAVLIANAVPFEVHYGESK